MTARPADPKYENVLRETQRRVSLKATDADIVAYHRGMRAIDHRTDELTRIEGILQRSLRKVKAKKTRLTEERSRLGAASDRETVERLVVCEVVYDARQGGVIFVRRKGATDVIPGSERPVSADERSVIAALEKEPAGAEDEGLASKLRLMEYAADAPPDDIKLQVDEAIDASHLAPELQEALLALEEDDEESEPKTAKPKKEKEKAPKAAKAPAETKAKGKGGKKKPTAAPPPAPEPAAPPAAAAADETAEPGPADIEPDSRPRPPVARAPEDGAVPPSEEDVTAEPAPIEEPAEDAGDEGALEPAAGEAPAVEAPAADEDEPSDFVGDDQPVETGDPDGQPADAQTSGGDEGGSEEPPYPEAFDADAEDEEEPWEDGSTPPPVVAAPADGDDHIPDYEGGGEDLMVVRPGAEAASPVVATPAPEPPPAPPVVSAPPPAPEPAAPPAAAAVSAAPEKKAPARKKKADAAAPSNGAAPIGAAPSNGAIDQAAPTRAAVAAAANGTATTPAEPVAKADPTPAAAPAASSGGDRTAANNFGLSPMIASKFGEAVVQFLGKEPLLASSASAALSKRFGTVVTPNLEAALLPMLNHLAATGTVHRKAAGNDMIFYIPEHAGSVDGWFAKHQRANA